MIPLSQGYTTMASAFCRKPFETFVAKGVSMTMFALRSSSCSAVVVPSVDSVGESSTPWGTGMFVCVD
jgi:hypothetical protein